MSREKRYDVVIREIPTRKIVSVIGENMSEAQAEKREMTGISRINSNYFVDTIPHKNK